MAENISLSEVHDPDTGPIDEPVLKTDEDPASRWKRLMTSQSQPIEHIYLAPSLTRTPTPPLLLDKSRELFYTAQPSNTHRDATEASSSSDVDDLSAHPANASVRANFLSISRT